MSLTPPATLGVYVHFPWCVRKCPYCDFNSHPLRGSLDEVGYRAALLEDLDAQLLSLDGQRIDSVFFGGGTPSLFSAETFADLLERMAPQLVEGAEITMEANPGSLEHKPLGAYHEAGINRLSLGAQSFNQAHLEVLGRIHGPEEVRTSFSSARRAGFDNINLDLMYALPGQTVGEARADLEAALDLEPEHLSWYQLTLEPKTEFYARPPELPDEDTVVEMESLGRQLLAARGFARYEVSAYARPARQARHNLNYWRFGDYLGVGAGAHGKRTGKAAVTRTVKPAQPRLYLANPTQITTTAVDPGDLPGEFLLNVLRLPDGASFADLQARTGCTAPALEPGWQHWVDAGLLLTDRLATTPRGYAHLDTLLEDLLH